MCSYRLCIYIYLVKYCITLLNIIILILLNRVYFSALENYKALILYNRCINSILFNALYYIDFCKVTKKHTFHVYGVS